MSKESNKLLQEEMEIFPYKGGIKLLPPTRSCKKLNENKIQLVDLLALKMSIYFLDSSSTTYLMNEYGATLCGFDSAKDSVGRTLLDVAECQSARQLMQNSQEVCKINSVRVFEERLLNHKGKEQAIFSIKFPWLDSNNQPRGSAGLSFSLQTESILDSLRQIRALGLFNHITSMVSDTVYGLNCTALTPRENDCAYWLIRGYSAKQIALKLGLSFRTVEDYLSNMKIKMNASSKQILIEKLIDKN